MKIAIIGGTGFVGSHIIDALLDAGHALRLLVRPGSEDKVERARDVTTVPGDIDSESALRDTLDGVDVVIYLVGILREFPNQGVTFEKMQYQGVVDVADIAAELGIRRFLLMSANGVDAQATAYQRSKFRAEQYVRGGDFDVTVFRPSVVFGDPRGRMEFATQLYRDIVRPPLPAIGFHAGFRPSTGAVLMSPVSAEDVAAAFARALDDPATIGGTYELGGPETLSWVEMIRRVADAVGTQKIILPMPIPVMRLAATVLDRLPFFPVTRDQLTMLEQGNVCDDSELRALTGELTVDGIRARVKGFKDEFFIDRIGIDTPSFLTLMKFGDMQKLVRSGDEILPKYFGIIVEGLRMPVDADYGHKLHAARLEQLGVDDAELPGVECTGKYGLSPAALLAMGYDEYDLSLSARFRQRDRDYAIEIASSAADMWRVDGELILVGDMLSEIALGSRSRPRMSEMRIEYTDLSMNERMVDYCKRRGLSDEEIHTAMVDSFAFIGRDNGIEFDEYVMDPFIEFLNGGETFIVTAKPLEPVTLSQISLYRPTDVPALLQLSAEVR